MQKPEFQFNVDVCGEFFEPQTGISGEFDSHVYNFVLPFKNLADTEEEIREDEVTPQKQSEMEDWLDKYFKEQILSNMPETSTYSITITGILREANTGIMIMVNKTFTKP